jgi:hypothetical protein
MPSWFGTDLLLVGKAVLSAVALFTYTTITGLAGFCLLFSIAQIFSSRWIRGSMLALFSLTVAAGIAALIIILIRTTRGLGGQIASAFLALPYILGLFGIFFVPGESDG